MAITEDALQTTGLSVPVISEARSQARLNDVDMKIAIKQGRERGLLHRVNAERFVLTQTLIQFAEAAEKTVETEPLSVVAFKNQLGIGRKLAIEILSILTVLASRVEAETTGQSSIEGL